MKSSKRPCAVCRCWYLPDPRTRHRQKTCGLDECRIEWRRRTQARWRARNPDYAAERRLRSQAEKAEKAKTGEATAVSIRAPPKAIDKVPWELGAEALGVPGALFIAFVLRLLLRGAKDETREQPTERKEEFW